MERFFANELHNEHFNDACTYVLVG